MASKGLKEPISALDSEQRLEAGRVRRKKIPRGALADLQLKKRQFDPIQELTRASEGRVHQLLGIKYARMSQSPFAFFRGSVAIMAADLGRLPHTNQQVQMCGDAHVQNLGSFAGLDSRLTFDINDFDETFRGPWEWDVKRMATSILLAGREATHKANACRESVRSFCTAYCQTVAKLSQLRLLDAARYRVNRGGKAQPVSAALAQSQRANPKELLKKYTEQTVNGRSRFVDARPTFWRLTHADLRRSLLGALKTYSDSLPFEHRHLFQFYKPVDVAFKVVGTGSVGLRDYVVLLEANGSADPLFLQIKQEVHSIYTPYCRGVEFGHQGRRVAVGQRLMQPQSDILLGWTTITGHHFLVRQLNDHKGNIDIQSLAGEGLSALANVAGELLARGHFRSGDGRAIAGYIGNGKKATEALLGFAESYAQVAEKDYESFLTAIKKKRVHTAKKF